MMKSKLFRVSLFCALLCVTPRTIIVHGSQNIKLADKKSVVYIIPPYKFYDPYLFETKAMLESKGITVMVASTTRNEISGSGGKKIKPDMTLDDINVSDYLLVAIIGGSGTTGAYYHHEQVKNILNKANDAGVYVGGICAGATIVARSGVVKGKRATGYDKREMIGGGATYVDSAVVVDGNLITAQEGCYKEFGQKLCEIFSKK